MKLYNQVLKDKSVLLLGPRFYGYCMRIKEQLEKMGANVDYEETFIFLEDKRNNKNTIDWIFRNIRNPNYRKKHTKKILKLAKQKTYDILLVISVFSASPIVIDVLKQKNPNIKTYIYFWDAFSTWNFSYQMKYFDYKYSFDYNDCVQYKKIGLRYLPLFWIPEQLCTEINREYDIVHIGSLHPKYVSRASVCSNIVKQCEEKGLKVFVYLVSDVKKDIRKMSFKQICKYLINKDYRKFANEIMSLPNYDQLVHSGSLSQEQVHLIEKKARCILDVNIDRAGIGMRVIGALANGQKIITNNKYIVNEDFYSKANIDIINDKGDYCVDKEWLQQETTRINLDSLRIDNWICHILDIQNDLR